MKRREIWSSLAVCALAAPLLADYIEQITPAVVASTHDEPIDGLGDSVDTVGTPGRVSLSSTAEDRATQEFVATGFPTFDISGAWLKGRVLSTDSTDVGLRTFEFLLYDANGLAEASDFQSVGTVVGTGQYHPPSETQFDYDLDVGAALLDLLDDGVTHVGLRVRCTSGSSPGDELSSLHSRLEIEHCLGDGLTFCYGDSGNCPGGAIGAPVSGCPHTAGPNGTDGARLIATGNAQFSNDSFGMYVSSGPSSFGILIQGGNAVSFPNGNANVPDSAGLFCVAPQLRGNVEVLNLGSGSDEGAIDDFQNQPFGVTGQAAGSPTYYQFWFRDTGNPNANAGAGAEFNFSNAVQIYWID